MTFFGSGTVICTCEQQIWSNIFAQSGGYIHYHLLFHFNW